MPYFKKKKFIENSIRCILNQSYQNFQIIIIDDELSLESSEVLKKIHSLDNRIKIINTGKKMLFIPKEFASNPKLAGAPIKVP